MTADAKALAAESWYGYGRWDAPYWFVGMEPGGDDTHASYNAWLEISGSENGDELVDCRQHHQWQLQKHGIDNPDWTQWHRERPPNKLQATWRPLILLTLAYKGEPCGTEDVRTYQRERWGAVNDETAVIELNALHAPNLSAKVEREKHRPDRIRSIRARMAESQPEFAVFYGTSYQAYYEQIVGNTFDADGYAWCGDTLCLLVPHSSRSGKTNEWWAEKGRAMRAMVDVRSNMTA